MARVLRKGWDAFSFVWRTGDAASMRMRADRHGDGNVLAVQIIGSK